MVDRYWQWILAGICAIFALFSLQFAAKTPYLTPGKLLNQGGVQVIDVGNPDELQHINYVRFVREHRGFPVFDPKSPNFAQNYQAHQPPLFYALAAPFFGENGRPVRGLNIVFGVALVVGLYYFGFWSTGDRAVGLGAASFACMPMVLALCSSVSNDPLLMMLLTWSCALFAATERFSDRALLLFGGGCTVAGLALLTKSSALALLPALALFAVRSEALKPVRIKALLLCGLPLLIALPWWIRNAQLYGDPLGMKLFSEAFQGTAQAEVFIRELGFGTYLSQWVTWWTSRSFVGVFSYMDIFLPNAVYFASFALLALFGLGWLRKGEASVNHSVKLMGVVFGFVVFALFLRFNLQYFQAQARYLYPAIAPLALLFGGGAHRLNRTWGWALVLVMNLLLGAFVLSLLDFEFARRVL